MEDINMKDDNCIFCKIANGEIPSRTIYEDDDFRVILDLAPATKGHALILPKEHFKNLYEISDDTAAKVLPLAKKMAEKMTKRLGCEGFNLIQNNNEIAGQSVFHFHMHLIPRYTDDNQNLVMKPNEVSADELDAVRDIINNEA
jgi:histidine triad (HIT) family protein